MKEMVVKLAVKDILYNLFTCRICVCVRARTSMCACVACKYETYMTGLLELFSL